MVVPDDWESVGGLYLPIHSYSRRMFHDYQVKWMTMEYRLTRKQWIDYKRQIFKTLCDNTDVVITFGLNQSYYVSKMLPRKYRKRHIAIPMDSNFYLLLSVIKNKCKKSDIKEAVICILKLLFYYWKENRLTVCAQELIYVSSYDACHVQRGHIRIKAKIDILPNGVTIPDFECDEGHVFKNKYRIGFIGCFTPTYIEDNIKFFLDFCKEELIKKYPQTEVVIAGKNMSSEQIMFLESYSFVKCLGEVKNLEEFYHYVDMVFSCVKKKSGILNKNLEAFAYKKCVLGFRHNFYAIEGSCDKKNCLMADTRQEFLRQIEDIMDGKTDIDQIGLNAYQLVLTQYSWDKRYSRLKALIDNI